MDFETAAVGQSSPEKVIRYPLRRVEPSLRKFVKVLQIDLDRLQRHHANMERYQILGEWSSLNKEQINTTRTVQQLKANIRQLEQTRRQVQVNDLPAFDAQVRDIQNQAVVAVQEVLSLPQIDSSDPVAYMPKSSLPLDNQQIAEDDSGAISPAHEQKQLLLERPLEISTGSEESWQELHCEQQETIDHIEDNVETAQVNVQEGASNLAKAAKWKAAVFPMAGALLGGVVGGPVGFLAGVKLGGLAALGGGIIGFTGGKIIKKRQDQITDMEMQNLSKKGSRSVPDLAHDQRDSGKGTLSEPTS